MVKKLKKMAEKQATAPAGLLDGLMGGALKDSAQQLWLAGQDTGWAGVRIDVIGVRVGRRRTPEVIHLRGVG